MNKFTTTLFIVLIVIILIIAGLVVYINSANSIRTNVLPNIDNQNMQTMDHGVMLHSIPNITDDKTFIEYVIPHHQEAIDSSLEVLKSTKDAELIAFLNNVIKTQSAEIGMLKGYYKVWFGKEYLDYGNYSKMMSLNGKTDKELEKAYVQGMLEHHSGIINSAKKVLTDSSFQYKPEILELSSNIVKNQEVDNQLLQKWLDEKYK